MNVLFLMSIFPSYPGFKSHLNKIVFAKTFFKLHVSFGILTFPYVRWTKNKNLVGPLAMGTTTWSFHFVNSKYSYCKQYYMMLLEQCGHIVLKGLDTVTWLDEDQIHVCSVTWRTTFMPLRKTFSALYFQLKKPSVEFWSNMCCIVLDIELRYQGNGSFYWWQSSGILFLSSKKIESLKVFKKIARNCVEKLTFGLKWAFKHSS